VTSTTDGKKYDVFICFCGKQDSAGICEHFPRGTMSVERIITPGIRVIPRPSLDDIVRAGTAFVTDTSFGGE